MTYTLARGIGWLTALTALALLPLAVARTGAIPPPRTFLVEFGVALGFVGLGLLVLQPLCSGRFQWLAPSFGMDNIIQYHREVGILGFIFVLAHPVILLVADPPFREYFDPRVNFLRAVFLMLVVVALIAILVTSIRREALGLSYEWWRLLHGGLSVLIVFIGIVHTFQVSHYTDAFWKQGVLGALAAGSIYAVFHTRVVRPWRSRRRPYEVAAVTGERDNSWSITLEPRGHGGMPVRPGQFVWITIGPTPFSLQQNPFSVASSAHRRELRLTAKVFGNFTASWRDLPHRATAYLEGPFGSFVPDHSPGTGLFLIMGGIGVTPAMGILRTLRDDGDRRPLTLIYANRNWEDVTYREELDELAGMLNLRVVHLPEEPPADWRGESGLLTKELLAKYLPDRPDTFQYMICGPDPFMDIAEVSLRELGVAWYRIYSERFNIV